jgi:hypothetical protein
MRESREASRLEIPTAVEAIVDVLYGTLVSGEDSEVTGRAWVLAVGAASLPIELAPSLATSRSSATARRALELGVALLVTSNSTGRLKSWSRWRASGGSRSSPRPWTATSAPG